MPRYIRNTVILAKLETTQNGDAAPVGATDAVLVSDLSITPLEASSIDRGLVRPFLGGSEQLVGTAYVRCGFTVELAGSGTAGTRVAYNDLIRACAFGEATLASPARVEYSPVTTSQETISIYWYDDGLLHKALGCKGTFRIAAREGSRPTLAFEFVGLYVAPAAASNPSASYTAFRAPPVVTRDFVTDITVGATYNAGAFTGGTIYPSTGMEIDIGNSAQFISLLSSQDVDITDRQMTGRMAIDLTAAQEASFYTDIRANTVRSLAMRIGNAAGNSWIIFAPRVQFTNPRKQDLNGRRMIGLDLRFVPSTGNDELRLVAL